MFKIIKNVITAVVETVKKEWGEYKIDKNCINGEEHVFARNTYMLYCKKCPKQVDLRKSCPYCH